MLQLVIHAGILLRVIARGTLVLAGRCRGKQQNWNSMWIVSGGEIVWRPLCMHIAGVFSMDGTVAPLQDICDLADKVSSPGCTWCQREGIVLLRVSCGSVAVSGCYFKVADRVTRVVASAQRDSVQWQPTVKFLFKQITSPTCAVLFEWRILRKVGLR